MRINWLLARLLAFGVLRRAPPGGLSCLPVFPPERVSLAGPAQLNGFHLGTTGLGWLRAFNG